MRNCLLQGILALLFTVGVSTVSSAATFLLTSDGLGMEEGNYGRTIHLDGVDVHAGQIGTELARTDGYLYLGSGSRGLEIRSGDGSVTSHVSVAETKTDRLEFDLSGLYELSEVSIGLNWFNRDSDRLALQIIGSEGTLEIDNQKMILSAYEETGRRSGIIRIDDLLLGHDIGTIQNVGVQNRSGQFWVNSLSLTWGADPVPDPASLWLLGSGLVGLAGWRFTRSKRA